MNAELGEGYLLLADISGYTAFLTKTEIEHSHAIIRELTALIRDRLAPPLEFVKLEGDAVFCVGRSELLSSGERVLELVEQCYLAFGDRLFDMTRATTCTCAACEAIGTLDLKFVVHHGSFVIDHDDGRIDLSGPDVILVHRLLKNTVIEQGGPAAYAFYSDRCTERMPTAAHLAPHVESYDAFGDIPGRVHDLAGAAAAIRGGRRERLDETTADVVTRVMIPAPPAIVWQYYVEPDKRPRWMTIETAVDFEPNGDGRIGPGAASHCAHGALGDARREYLDWRPFDYLTCRWLPMPETTLLPPALETVELVADSGGTCFTWYLRADDRSDEGVAALTAMSDVLDEFTRLGAETLVKVLAEDGLLDSVSD